MAKRRRIFVLNDPFALRVSPHLAEEIGLNESIVLLQLEFLISISDNERDGRVWTYHSLDDLRATYFPWWSRATIARTIKALEERGLILIGNFNRAGFDRTQWFALNYDGIESLRSVRLETSISQNETRASQSETSTSHRDTSASQNGTTIPETTSETTPEKSGPEDWLKRYDEQEKILRQARKRGLGT